MDDDTIESQLRGGPPRRFLVAAANHTPDGPLHLGHIGGPFLTADAFSRAQRSLGHEVTTASSADVDESCALLAATMESRSPDELATANQRLAHESLQGLDMAPEIYIDLHTEPARTAYAGNSDALVKALDADQRIRIERHGFLSLNGRKFSIAARHVIWAHEYLAAGLPVDELRGYLASVSGKDATRDFRTSEFAQWTRDVLATRWHRVVSEVLSRDLPSSAREDMPDAIIAHRALAEFHALMSPPSCDLAAGLAVLDSWIRWHACGDRPTSPATFLRVTALLAWPFMPSWAGGLWRATGLTGSPRVRELGVPFRPCAHELTAFRAVCAATVTALIPAQSPVSGDVRTRV